MLPRLDAFSLVAKSEGIQGSRSSLRLAEIFNQSGKLLERLIAAWHVCRGAGVRQFILLAFSGFEGHGQNR